MVLLGNATQKQEPVLTILASSACSCNLRPLCLAIDDPACCLAVVLPTGPDKRRHSTSAAAGRQFWGEYQSFVPDVLWHDTDMLGNGMLGGIHINEAHAGVGRSFLRRREWRLPTEDVPGAAAIATVATAVGAAAAGRRVRELRRSG